MDSKFEYKITYKDGTVKTVYTETKYKIGQGCLILKCRYEEMIIPMNTISGFEETDLLELEKRMDELHTEYEQRIQREKQEKREKREKIKKGITNVLTSIGKVLSSAIKR